MFNIDNVISGDALSISLTGMAIVFCGLLLISLFIRLLPVVLELISRVFPDKDKIATLQEKKERKIAEQQEEEDKDLASVIGLVMQMEAANLQLTEEQEDIDIVNVVGLVLQLEEERYLPTPMSA